MATAPFNPNEASPASGDLISQFPNDEQTFRDIIESWLLTISTNMGVVKTAALPDDLGDNKQVGGGNFYLDAATASNFNLWFRRGDGSNGGLLYRSDSDNTLRLRTYAADGTTVLSQFILDGDSAGISWSGVASGDGSGLTNLPAASLTGTIADARLPTTMTGKTFSTTVTFNSPLSAASNIDLTNGAARFRQTNAGSSAILSANGGAVLLRPIDGSGTGQFIVGPTGDVTANGSVTATGVFNGNGSGLTNVDAETFDGQNYDYFQRDLRALASVELGQNAAAENTYIDFHTTLTVSDHSARIISGAGGTFEISNALAGKDLSLETNGGRVLSNSTIEVTGSVIPTGSLELIRSDGGAKLAQAGGDFFLQQTNGVGGYEENWFAARRHGAVELFHNGSLRLYTTAAGVQWAGVATGDGSGITNVDAASLAGATKNTGNVANSIVQRNGSGDIITRLFRSEYASTNSNIGAIMTQVDVGGTGDNYLRPSTPAQLATALPIIGHGQTWQDMSASRVANTSYRNTTGRPIMVATIMTDGSSFQVSTNNSTWVTVMNGDADQDSGSNPGGIIVPANHYYKVVGGFNLIWSELR